MTLLTSVEDVVRAVLVNQFDVDPAEVTLDAHVAKDLGADSLDFVELLIQFEERFAMEIPDDDLERFGTVQDLVTYFQERHAVPATPPKDGWH